MAMLSRRQLLLLAGEAAGAGLLAGCAVSPLLLKEQFSDFGDQARPYLGLATSLREEPDYRPRIEGTVPAELSGGTLYRNGPGLFDRDGRRKRNLLDGDGLIQAFRFDGQGVQYRARFVRTEKFVEEQQAGRFIYPSWSTQAPGGFWGNFLAAGRMKSQAGITVFPWQGRLFAFDECALPYELDPVSLATVGISSLGLPPQQSVYAAHAKFDAATGEWVHFGIEYGPSPRIHVTIFRPDGRLKKHRIIAMPRYVYMHDWFVAGRYLVFVLHPVEIAYLQFLFGIRSMVDSLRWRPEQGNLLMVVGREGDDEPVLLESDAVFMWHSFNAYERGSEIIADFIGYRNPDHFVGSDPVASAVMSGRRGTFDHPGELCRYVLQPGNRSIRYEPSGQGNYEWPRINDRHLCRPHRYGYLVKTRPGDFFWSLVSRVDLQSGKTDSYDFGPGNYCGEPVFVPLPGRSYAAEAAEEPGFLLTQVYCSAQRLSNLAILRAERLGDGPVATVRLTHHVPFSYHGWWLPAA